ncbi:MAG: hypothetical protein JWP25_4485 [Bradyrhizobium sp.]|jgi:hypothetical protein|nr:hypothetical protein [Bradyrhizobium sp.]
MPKADRVHNTPPLNSSSNIVAEPTTAGPVDSSDPVFAAIEAHAKASDELWALHEESLAVGPPTTRITSR